MVDFPKLWVFLGTHVNFYMAFPSVFLRFLGTKCLEVPAWPLCQGRLGARSMELGRFPLSVLSRGVILGVSELGGACGALPGSFCPPQPGGNRGGGHGPCGSRSPFCLILRKEWLSWLPASLSSSCQMSSLEPWAWSRIQHLPPVEITL